MLIIDKYILGHNKCKIKIKLGNCETHYTLHGALYKINNSTQARFRFLSLVAVHKALKDSALCTDRSKEPAYELLILYNCM